MDRGNHPASRGWKRYYWLSCTCSALGLLIYVIRLQAEPDDTADHTPDECWSLGGIYYNPQDPALFVRSRLGSGFTLNMATRWSCTFLIVLFGESRCWPVS